MKRVSPVVLAFCFAGSLAQAAVICLPPEGKSLADVVAGSFFYDPSEHALYCRLPDSGA